MAALLHVALLCMLGDASAVPDAASAVISPLPSPAQVPQPAPLQAVPAQASPAQALPDASTLSSVLPPVNIDAALPAVQSAMQNPLPGVEADPSLKTLDTEYHKLEGKSKKVYDSIKGKIRGEADKIEGSITNEARKIRGSIRGEAVKIGQKIKGGIQGEAQKIEGSIRGEAEKIKGQGEQVYQKIDKMPVGEKAGVAVGATVGAAAVVGAIGGLAEAATEAAMKSQQKRIEVAQETAEVLGTTLPPGIQKVFVPVDVPVTTTAEYIFSWPTLYEKGTANDTGGKIAESTLMGAAIVGFCSVILFGLGAAIYVSRRSQSRSVSRLSEAAVSDDEPLMA